MYYYKVDCWIPPRSGFDLARKNKAFHFFESVANKLSGDKAEKILSYINEFKKQSEGLVLKTFMMESDKQVFDPEKEFMGEVKKEYPEAKLAHWELLEATISKKPLE